MMERRIGLVITIGLTVSTFAGAAPEGAALFRKSCAPCHGVDGSGNTPVGKTLKARDLRSAEVSRLSDEEIARIVKNGKGKMPGFGSLAQEDIDALIAFVRQIQKK